MTSLTIENLDEDLTDRLRSRAARRGRSIEEEAESLIRNGLAEPSCPTGADLADAIQELFAPFGDIELEVPPRTPLGQPPRFDKRFDP